jgi:hypothetical protein
VKIGLWPSGGRRRCADFGFRHLQEFASLRSNISIFVEVCKRQTWWQRSPRLPKRIVSERLELRR